MSNLFDGDSPSSNLYEYTVSEISGSIKRTVENAFEHVRLRGEISGYRGPHSSGHAYFALKDDRARIDAVIWKGVFGRLKFRPEEGMEVIATGKVTTFPGSSKYQIVIENLEPAGAGALMALLEERKRKLGAEGLFDEARKQLLPFMPRVIGVVTSPTGAVIRDILHRISDRFPVHVIVWPVRVQGEGSGDEVANAIRGFNALEPEGDIRRPDVLIVARGGGSLEDLWGFNDEAVVRAAADSAIPLISAVGHETDWTLIDYAADMRAPTPTGAAEMAVPVKAELEAQVASLDARLKGSMTRNLDRSRQNLRSLARALPSLDQILAMPRRRFDEAAAGLGRGLQLNTLNKRRTFDNTAYKLRPDVLQNRISQHRQRVGEQMLRADRQVERLIDRSRSRIANAETSLRALPHQLKREISRTLERLSTLSARSDIAVNAMLSRQRSALVAQNRMLDSLSYKNVLKRGYAVIRNEDDAVISAAHLVTGGDRLTIEFADGRVNATADDGDEPASPIPKKKAAKSQQPTKPQQGSLF
ncbi:exodeoxyribonuclease VII large subunit [Rhizobium sp. L1K21]|uniref:exodeoxyribonuclease VII large subunit n=1 Tax=Rhizobium sp. L1K21 TaxID=2954933 RepID=UPI002092467F|nr:exodeoxyribonuclease VII large subunit [Rhizobium sp. L1K21]MCO6185530.1 exodeoxyribonuclease VII large subunit [Rhizobium sp. L1K21]